MGSFGDDDNIGLKQRLGKLKMMNFDLHGIGKLSLTSTLVGEGLFGIAEVGAGALRSGASGPV